MVLPVQVTCHNIFSFIMKLYILIDGVMISSGGVGTVIAHWIVEGRPPFDMYNLDIARCLGYHNNKR